MVGVALILLGILAGVAPYIPIPEIAGQTDMQIVGESHLTYSRSFDIKPFYVVRLTFSLPAEARVEGTLRILGGNEDVDLYLTDSSGGRLYDPGRVHGTYRFTFPVPKNDHYNIYIDNRFSWITFKSVSINFDLYTPRVVSRTVDETEYRDMRFLLPTSGVLILVGMGLIASRRIRGVPELERRIADLETSLAGRHQVITSLERRLTDLTAAVADRNVKIRALEDRGTKRDEEIKRLEGLLAERDRWIDKLKAQVSTGDRIIDDLKTKLAERDAEIEKLKRKASKKAG